MAFRMSGYALMVKYPDDPWDILQFSLTREPLELEIRKRRQGRNFIVRVAWQTGFEVLPDA